MTVRIAAGILFLVSTFAMAASEGLVDAMRGPQRGEGVES